jgi:hypothetical protein
MPRKLFFSAGAAGKKGAVQGGSHAREACAMLCIGAMNVGAHQKKAGD